MSHECGCQCGATATRSGPAGITPELTVEEVGHRVPGALAVLQRLGVNHCCGAQLTLGEAAASAGVAVETLLGALRAVASVPA